MKLKKALWYRTTPLTAKRRAFFKAAGYKPVKLVEKLVFLPIPTEPTTYAGCMLYVQHLLNLMKAHGAKSIICRKWDSLFLIRECRKHLMCCSYEDHQLLDKAISALSVHYGLPKTVIGWREQVLIPSISDLPIEAKVDTGATTSVLHAFEVSKVADNRVMFKFHPKPGSEELVTRYAEIVRYAPVTDSSGVSQHRYFIHEFVKIGCDPNHGAMVEMSLTNRDDMLYPMLLGRKALRGEYVVDCRKTDVLYDKMHNESLSKTVTVEVIEA
jgi:hypothetical protein